MEDADIKMEFPKTAPRTGRTRDGVLIQGYGGTSGFGCGMPGCTQMALIGSYHCRAHASDERRRREQQR